MIMTRTINTVFANMEDALKKLEEHPPGDMYRTAHLEAAVKQLPLFLSMAADLAILVEDLMIPAVRVSTDPDSGPATEEAAHSPNGQYL